MAIISPATAEAIHDAARRLRSGELVVFPTETVYGLGAHALDAAAVEKIFVLKGRPATNPVIVHVLDASQAKSLTTAWPEDATRLADAFWPGPLTLVLPKSDRVPGIVTAQGPTVAVRAPRHPVARALSQHAGIPIAAPSANRSTKLSPTRAEHVDLDAFILDGGPCESGIESTVYDVEQKRVLRPGPITAAMIAAIVGDAETGSVSSVISRSPGLMDRHYEPRTPLRLVTEPKPGMIAELDPSRPAAELEAILYDTLHRYDRLGRAELIVQLPPDRPEYAALRDRLLRAGRIVADS